MTPPALFLSLCLQGVGGALGRSPTAPMNMRGAIDSTEQALGPLFLDDPATVGAGNLNADALAETAELELGVVPRPHTSFGLHVRATTVVVAASYGLTGDLDLSAVLPIVAETLEAHATVGPFGGHTTLSASGASDLGIRAKYHFAPDLSATLEAVFPTGDSARGLGTGTYWLSPGLAASVPVGDRLELNADLAADVNLSFANRSGATYGVGASMLLGPVAVIGEFLGGVGHEQPLVLFGSDLSRGTTFDLAFGLRAPLPGGLVGFVAGTYALSHGGVRTAGVAPVAGVGATF